MFPVGYSVAVARPFVGEGRVFLSLTGPLVWRPYEVKLQDVRACAMSLAAVAWRLQATAAEPRAVSSGGN